jgi:hypothetical protein
VSLSLQAKDLQEPEPVVNLSSICSAVRTVFELCYLVCHSLQAKELQEPEAVDGLAGGGFGKKVKHWLLFGSLLACSMSAP